MKSEVVLREFQRLLEPGTVAGLTERQVVDRFVERGDPIAFEAIVTRHGPMVYALCRQTLVDSNDVDDAFQATFLILIKKAGTLRQPERLGPWLHGVAYRVAKRIRRARRSMPLPDNLAGPRLACPVEDDEQRDLLHEEIERLPEKYRVPIVLCCLEGLTPNEAASRLGWPVGTVHGRLSRARGRIRDRLARRGVVVSGSFPELLAGVRPGQIMMPEASRLAVLALVRGTVPASLEILVKGVLTAMIAEKLKQMGMIALFTFIGMATATTALFAYQGTLASPKAVTTETATQDVKRNEAHETKAIPAAKSSPVGQLPRENRERARTDAEIEESHRKLDRLLADAALIQIELDITRKGIEKAFEFLRSPELRSFENDSRLTKNERMAAAERTQRRNEYMEKQLMSDKEGYSENWMKLARLEREIMRQSRILGVAPESASIETELSRRLDGLEKKIDLIIDSLPARQQP